MICAPTFTGASFTTAKTWKPQCLSEDKWIKILWYTDSGILVSHKNEGNPALCNNTNEPGGYHPKLNKPDIGNKPKQNTTAWSHSYVESKKKKNETHRSREQNVPSQGQEQEEMGDVGQRV